MENKGKNTNRKPSPLFGEGVNRQVDGRGECEQIWKTVSYKATVNTCLSFLNEVMASESFFEEQSDAVKVSETPYPTNGSGKNLAKNTGVKYTFCDYPTPDSSLSLITLWFRSAHSHTSTAQEWRQGCFGFFYDILTCVRKLAPIASQARHFPPSSGEAND